MKRFLARQWKAFVILAAALDLVLVFGPPLFSGDITDMAVLPVRWGVMMLGVMAVNLAQEDSTKSNRPAQWAVAYLIFGFTAAALINGFFNGFP